MDEFTMCAFALYPDGRAGEAFAEVSGASLVDCFAEMAAEVGGWLPKARAVDAGGGAPRAVELTLEWDGAAAPEPGAGTCPAQGDGALRLTRPRRRIVTCIRRPRGHVGIASPAGLPSVGQ